MGFMKKSNVLQGRQSFAGLVKKGKVNLYYLSSSAKFFKNKKF